LLVSKGDPLVQVHGGIRLVVGCPEARESVSVMGVLVGARRLPDWWFTGQTVMRCAAEAPNAESGLRCSAAGQRDATGERSVSLAKIGV
jgi:hypothetical protein